MISSNSRPLAVVTGASSGIGYELAKQFAKNGFDLVVAAEDRSIIEAQQAFAELNVSVECVQVDLSTFDGVESFVAKLHANSRPIDAVALNAGVGVGGEFANETNLEEELAMIRLNVLSTVHLAKRLLPAMLDRNEGKILFTSSLAATAPGPYYAVYAATKAFIQSFAEALHYELEDSGVTVTALMPGATDTNFFARAHMENTKAAQSQKDDPAAVAKDGFEALMAGKDHVVAGSMKNKLQATLGKFTSEQTRAGMQAKEIRPGSALDA